MVLKDSKSCSTLSLRAVSTFWILVTLIASSSGFPQGNTSNSTTVDPNSNSSSTTITDEVSNSTIATTISPTNEATNTEPASEETTSSPINNDSTIAYLFNTEGGNETEASSTLSPENNSSHNTTLQEQSNQNEGSNPTTTATTTTSPSVTETLTSHPSNDTPIATTINVLSTRVGETTVFEEGHTNQSKELDERIGDLQYQVYAIFASFGIISLIIILLIIALAMSISKLKEQVSSTRHVPYIPDNRTGDQIHAYDNSAFSSGHEMQERRRPHMDKEPSKQGYGVQNGNNAYERQKEAESSQKSKDVGGVDRDSKSTLMRYEDGVIPFQHEGEEPSPNGSMRRKPSS